MNLPNLVEARKRTNNKVLNQEYSFPDEYKKLGLNKKYFLRTYGCQMNEHDSENIKGLLNKMSYTETDEMNDADLIILNTCSIRENAHNKAFGMLGRIKHLKEETKRNDLIVALCGCMAQEEVVVQEIMQKYRFVNFVFGTHNLGDLPKLISESSNTNKTNFEVYSIEGSVVEDLPMVRNSKYKAFVNIIYGCDKFCTYCIVPYTRGKQRSRKMADILREVDELIVSGYKEVTLLGQNVNAYGKDLEENVTLADLLSAIGNKKIDRVRFVTSHPWDFTDEMIEVIKKYPNIMPQVHLPLQSGSDRILKLMGRRYTSDSYKKLFDKLKEVPNMAITTDIIVGFPGETEEDFQKTIDMVNYCQYDGAFTFIYSPREGTPAAKLYDKDNTKLEVKEDRLYRLNALINDYSLKSNQKLVGQTVKVLVDGMSSKENELCGYTETNKLVNFSGPLDLIGQIVNVRIDDAKSFSLDGVYVD